MWATLFTKDAISIWSWGVRSMLKSRLLHITSTSTPQRKNVPANIDSPDTSTWGEPAATWPSSSCDIATYFKVSGSRPPTSNIQEAELPKDQTLVFGTSSRV